MAQDSVESFTILGIVLACVGVVILLLSLLDYLQDGKTESLVPVFGIMGISFGLLLYAKGKKSQAQE
jgi:uncharacterized membrane protein YbhN (UPF0104 family)